MKKGRIKYVPNSVVQEVDIIKQQEQNIQREVEAMNRMVEYSIIGRQFTKKNNKKGYLFDLMTYIVGFFGVAVIIFFFCYAGHEIIVNLQGQESINQSAPALDVLNDTDGLLNKMDYVLLLLFGGFLLVLMIGGWLVSENKLFMVLYVIFDLMTIGLSILLANTWETITSITLFSSAILKFPIVNHLILNYPVYTAIAGVLGLFIMLAKPFLVTQEGGY